MSKLSRYFIPEKAETRAQTLRHEALFFYALFLFFLQFSVRYLTVNFPGVLGFASNIAVQDVFNDTNKRRIENGLVPLRLNGQLSVAAQKKAQDMFAKGYWAHIAPDGATPWSFVLGSGYDYVYAGENLAKDFQNSDDVVNAWYASPSHRENLLSGNYQDIGLAVVNGVLNGFETTLVVQMFGAHQSSSFLAEAKSSPSVPAVPVVTSVPQPTAAPLGKTILGPSLEQPKLSAGVEMAAAAPQYLTLAPEPLTPTLKRPLIPVIDALKVAKSVSFAFGFFLFGLFVLDGIFVIRRRHLRLSGHNLAHLGILLLLLGATWYTSVGTIV